MTTLPPEMLGYAERLYKHLPEVLLFLGDPFLGDNYMLPPTRGAELKIQETADYKLLYLRVNRAPRPWRPQLPVSRAPAPAATRAAAGPAGVAAGPRTGLRPTMVPPPMPPPVVTAAAAAAALAPLGRVQAYPSELPPAPPLPPNPAFMPSPQQLPDGMDDWCRSSQLGPQEFCRASYGPLAADECSLRGVFGSASSESFDRHSDSLDGRTPTKRTRVAAVAAASAGASSAAAAASCAAAAGLAAAEAALAAGNAASSSFSVAACASASSGSRGGGPLEGLSPAVRRGRRNDSTTVHEAQSVLEEAWRPSDFELEDAFPRSGGPLDQMRTRTFVGLKERRNFGLRQTFSARLQLDGPNKRMSVTSWDSNSPAVLVAEEAKMARPMPGAFPTHRSLLFFDWDDTLCPTSWIRQQLVAHFSHLAEWVDTGSFSDPDSESVPEWFWHPLPDLPDMQEAMETFQRAVIDVLQVAQTLGVVCIVTNAKVGWVQRTVRKWLPKLARYIFGHGTRPPIQILYAKEAMETRWGGSGPDADLPYVDGLRNYMLWKKEAMIEALSRVDDIYRVAPTDGNDDGAQATPRTRDRGAARLVNLLSVGDNEAEMQAPLLACLTRRGASSTPRAASAPPVGRRHGPGDPYIKLVKFQGFPDVHQIEAQLRCLQVALPRLVAARCHVRIDPAELLSFKASRPADASSRDAKSSPSPAAAVPPLPGAGVGAGAEEENYGDEATLRDVIDQDMNFMRRLQTQTI
eukprot:TRINITY_DN6047_c0_g1_i1.p1 TRINITY_DN6047_c0_g1~~TRINITY_DN6047_c0_g1_i1.p1  ORF type:complete len:746 (+),score=149.10 TRINITY_DN6047_c0_g1_i1:147-2384(+)